MRASETTYEKVAENCSAFEPKKDAERTTNSTCDSCCCNVSCTTCKYTPTLHQMKKTSDVVFKFLTNRKK